MHRPVRGGRSRGNQRYATQAGEGQARGRWQRQAAGRVVVDQGQDRGAAHDDGSGRGVVSQGCRCLQGARMHPCTLALLNSQTDTHKSFLSTLLSSVQGFNPVSAAPLNIPAIPSASRLAESVQEKLDAEGSGVLNWMDDRRLSPVAEGRARVA